MYGAVNCLAQTEWDVKVVGWTGPVKTNVQQTSAHLDAKGHVVGNLEVGDPGTRLSQSDKSEYTRIINGDIEGQNISSTAEYIPVWSLPLDAKDKNMTQRATVQQQNSVTLYAENGREANGLIANPATVIWKCLHYVMDSNMGNETSTRNWWLEFIRINQLYTERIMQIYKPGDLSMDDSAYARANS